MAAAAAEEEEEKDAAGVASTTTNSKLLQAEGEGGAGAPTLRSSSGNCNCNASARRVSNNTTRAPGGRLPLQALLPHRQTPSRHAQRHRPFQAFSTTRPGDGTFRPPTGPDQPRPPPPLLPRLQHVRQRRITILQLPVAIMSLAGSASGSGDAAGISGWGQSAGCCTPARRRWWAKPRPCKTWTSWTSGSSRGGATAWSD